MTQNQVYIYTIHSSPASIVTSFLPPHLIQYNHCLFPVRNVPFFSFCVSHLTCKHPSTTCPNKESWWLITPHWGSLRCPPTERCVRICSSIGVCAKIVFILLIGSKVSTHWALCRPPSCISFFRFDMHSFTWPLSSTIWQTGNTNQYGSHLA